MTRKKARVEDLFGKLLTSTEVAEMFRVDPKTVMRWAAEGSITSIRTPGGRLRYREQEILELLEEYSQPGS